MTIDRLLLSLFTELGFSDVNECENDTVCGDNAHCNNTEGSYNCTCLTGFSGIPCAGMLPSCVSLFHDLKVIAFRYR